MALPYLTTASIGFGSIILTPTTGNAANVAFIANEFTLTEPTEQTMRTTELGAPNGYVMFKDRRTVRGQLQLATNTTLAPECGDEFIFNRPNAGNITFAMSEIGIPRRPRDLWVVDFQALEKA